MPTIVPATHYEQLITDLNGLYEKRADEGWVYLNYQTQVFLANPQTVWHILKAVGQEFLTNGLMNDG